MKKKENRRRAASTHRPGPGPGVRRTSERTTAAIGRCLGSEVSLTLTACLRGDIPGCIMLLDNRAVNSQCVTTFQLKRPLLN